jgi:hypothetical protein
VRETKSDVELLAFVPAAAPAELDAAFTVERRKFRYPAAEAAGGERELDQVREVPLVHVAGYLALASSHVRKSLKFSLPAARVRARPMLAARAEQGDCRPSAGACRAS